METLRLLFENKLCNILKYLSFIVLPIISVLYCVGATFFNFPYPLIIIGGINGIAFVIGIVLCIFTNNEYKHLTSIENYRKGIK